jgi:alanyl-tRNA synthetase
VRIEGLDIEFEMKNAEKVGKAVLHILDKEIPGDISTLKGKSVHVKIDENRRNQLRAHHTGAKKTTEQAHLDITHFKSISKDEEKAIENEANRIINNCHSINKYFMDKAEAEKKFGFHLYQGGIVPGNTLRVVNIEGVDTEACCGTHCDNTAEVGWVRILKSQRISDGIVRLYYVA